MTPSQRESVKDVLQLALEAMHGHEAMGESQLRALCGGDAEVHAELLRLLAARGLLGAFLEGNGTAEKDWQPGDLIGNRYRLKEILGEGGFGVAYLAADESLGGRNVAVKLLKAGIFAGETLTREIQALTEIHHTGVVGILDAGTASGGRQFLVLRHVKGKTLRQALEESGTLGTAAVRRLMLQLGDAIATCHLRGVLHLDLKPENIILQHFGSGREQAVILDFGVAAVFGEEALGAGRFESPRYRAPERVLTKRSDIYSLGSIAAECLSGQTGAAVAALPGPWRRWAAACCAEDPARRWGSAEEMTQNLPGSTQSWRWTALAAGLALGMLALRWIGDGGYPRIGDFAPLTSDAGDEEEPTVSRDGKTLVYAATGGIFQQFNIHVKHLDTGASENLTHGELRESQPVISGDGKQLAFARAISNGISRLLIKKLAGGEETEMLRASLNGHCWSPDGSFLIAALSEDRDSRCRLYRIDAANRTRRLLNEEPASQDSLMSWNDKNPSLSADGKRILFLRSSLKGSQDIYAGSLNRDATAVTNLRRITHMERSMRSARWSADGRSIFFLAGTAAHMSLWVTRSDGRTQPHRYGDPGQNLDYLEVASQPARLIVSRSTVDQNIWSGALHGTGAITDAHPIVASTWDDEEQKLSPDGKWLAFNSHRSGAEEMWISRPDGSDQRPLSRIGNCEDVAPVWRWDSAAVIMRCKQAGESKRFELQLQGGAILDFNPRGLEEKDQIIAWSRDGKWLYLRSERSGEGRFELWRLELATGEAEKLSWRRADVMAETGDGTIFFASRNDGASVYRLGTDGKEDVAVTRTTRRMFALGRQGIYFVTDLVNPVLRFHRFQDGVEFDLLKLQKRPGFGFALTPDEKYVLWTQMDRDGTDLYSAPIQ